MDRTIKKSYRQIKIQNKLHTHPPKRTENPNHKSKKNSKKLQKNGNIIKLDKCSDKNFISPIVITVKRDKTIELAMDSKVINKAIHKNRYQMHNIDCLMDNIAQSISESSHESKVYFSTIDLRYAYSQIPLDEATTKHYRWPSYWNIQIHNRFLRTNRYARRISKGYRHHTKRPQKHI